MGVGSTPAATAGAFSTSTLDRSAVPDTGVSTPVTLSNLYVVVLVVVRVADVYVPYTSYGWSFCVRDEDDGFQLDPEFDEYRNTVSLMPASVE